MIVIAIILGIAGFLYAGLIVSLAWGYAKLPDFRKDTKINTQPDTFISIVIAARNEGKNVASCLHDLLNQDYSKADFEIIVVDDHSVDNTIREIQKIQREHPLVKLISLPDAQFSSQGKKAALNAGIALAKGELIITTDADCRFTSQWLSSFASYYEQYHPVMMSGPVEFMPQNNIAGKFMELEFISLVTSGAGSLGLKKPLMCNGANLAFRRDVFLELNAFDSSKKWASGDDMFLMHSVQKKFGSDAIHFIKSQHAIVKTKAPAGIYEFLMQRIRWGSKTRAYPNTFTGIAAVIVLLNAMMLLGSTLLLMFFPVLIYPVLAGWVLKICSDFLLLYKGCSFFQRRTLLFWLIPFQVVHAIYLTLSAIMAGFSGYSWKGRQH